MADRSKMQDFTQYLLQWAREHPRPLPWKGERDPYLIWLSEIILQQTRVEQGLPYFERFRTAYPTVEDLAAAPEDDVMKHWQGLGYYSRARNLHATARYVAEERGGEFPDSYAGLLALKGVGPYTAAAIGAFAFDLPTAVVDGNVYRVLSRVFGIDTPIDTTNGKKEFTVLANELIDPSCPGDYNQAIMDFGATQCKPIPDCQKCPMQPFCTAFATDKVGDYPVKSKRLKKRTRYFNYLVLTTEGTKVAIQKRTHKDIWQGLYEFPLFESSQLLKRPSDLKEMEKWKLENPAAIQKRGPYKQTLSHQYIVATFWEIEVQEKPSSSWIWVDRENLSTFAVPKIIHWYLEDKSLYLNL